MQELGTSYGLLSMHALSSPLATLWTAKTKAVDVETEEAEVTKAKAKVKKQAKGSRERPQRQDGAALPAVACKRQTPKKRQTRQGGPSRYQ
jgi:hypothetical protein